MHSENWFHAINRIFQGCTYARPRGAGQPSIAEARYDVPSLSVPRMVDEDVHLNLVEPQRPLEDMLSDGFEAADGGRVDGVRRRAGL